jgi:exonuclease VII large subunit
MNDDNLVPPCVSAAKMFDISQLHQQRWQDQLLPVDTVLAEEDVTVLRQELETAHHLLQYQQRLIDSLTEQLVSYETHQAQLHHDLTKAERDSQREAEKLKEFQAICQDLRSQLRRQQARICEYKTVFKGNSNHTLVSPAAHKVSSHRLVSFGYTSLAVENRPSAPSSPVSPWSATDPANLSNAFAICCRQLATLGLARSPEAQDNPSKPLPSVASKASGNMIHQRAKSSSTHLELPSFVH